MIGATVGSYVIEKKLGEGGMGAVYAARHRTLGRAAAVKVLLPQYSAAPDIVQRFFNEAKAATSIHHPGIVEVYDFGTVEDGTAYIAMELLKGETLGARADRGLALREALGIVRLICGALGAAHDAGIIHRDLKPDNVFVIPDPDVPGGERIKLLDFGIAKLTQAAAGPGSLASTKTQTGSLLGTPTYMAPEQCRGVTVDHRADIYALGCILYELIAGEPPFSGEGVGDILGAHMFQAPEPIEDRAPTVPPEIAALVARMLAKRPAERPASLRDVVAAIDAVGDSKLSTLRPEPRAAALGHSTTLQASATSKAISSPDRRRGRSLLVPALAGVALLGAGVAVSLSMSSRARTSAVTEPAAADAMAAAPSVAVAADAAALATPDASPAVIAVELDSIPSGSKVLLDGAVVGTTPFRTTRPRTDASLRYVVRRDGFVDGVVAERATADIKKTVRLVARPRSQASAGSATGSDRGSATHDSGDESVNPFPE
jgi:serine/threonine-protein kinase